jgi:hypothetical protein
LQILKKYRAETLLPKFLKKYSTQAYFINYINLHTMKRSTRYVNFELMASLFVISFLISIQSSYAQTYANATSNRSGTFDCLVLGCSTTTVDDPGNARDGSNADGTKARMFSNVVLGLGGGKAYLTLRFASSVPAQETVYVKIDKPTTTGILSSILGFVGLAGTNITGQLKSGATSTTDGSNVSTESTKIITDATGTNYYLAITPSAGNSTDFNAVRIEVSASFDLSSSVELNVYNAFYNDVAVDANCGLAQYTSFGEETGLSVNLSDAVKNPSNAIDGNLATASEIGSGLANVGLFTTLSQTVIFRQPSAATDQAVVYLSTGASVLDVNLFSGLQIRAFNGAVPAGDQTPLASLISLNLLGFPAGIPANTIVPFYYSPTGSHDRVIITLSSAIDAALFDGGIYLHEVKQVTSKPTLSSKLVYQFGSATPNVSATSAGNKIFWQGPLPATTNLNATSLTSPAAFPVSVSSNGEYIAVSVKPSTCQTTFSDSTKLRVVVLTDESETTHGISGLPLDNGGVIKASSPGHAFEFVTTSILPVGSNIIVDKESGVVSSTGLPVVTEITVYTIVIDIQENDVSTGLTLTEQLTVYPPMDFEGGEFPKASDLSNSYSKDLTEMFGAATGGTGENYVYSIDNPGLPDARIAATGLPTGFTLSTAGVLSGDPSGADPDTYEFTIYASDGIQQTSAAFELTIVDGPLPVKLLSFKASREGQTALLSWATTEETNSERFDLERSPNGKIWEVIGQKASSGESIQLKNYSLSDNRPLNGENLYRLKMVDLDGSFAYSHIASLKFEIKNNVYPNPVTNFENLLIDVDDWNKVGSVTITDVLGKTVYQSSSALPNGISMREFSAGLYIVQVKLKNGTGTSYKIVKR